MQIFKSLFGGGGNSMTVTDVKAQIDEGNKPYIIDVRQSAEFKSGHIPGAQLVPLDKLSQHMSKLPKDREILCVCRSGARSGSAARQLTNAGYTAINMRGGMMSWQSAGFPVKRGS